VRIHRHGWGRRLQKPDIFIQAVVCSWAALLFALVKTNEHVQVHVTLRSYRRAAVFRARYICWLLATRPAQEMLTHVKGSLW